MKTSSCEAAVAPVSEGVRISETLPWKQVPAFVTRGRRGVKAPLLPPWEGKSVGRK